MIGVSTILAIKQRCANGDSVAQIARDEGVSEPTVRKYRDMDIDRAHVAVRVEVHDLDDRRAERLAVEGHLLAQLGMLDAVA